MRVNPHPAMSDIIYLAVSAAFFGLTVLYARFCDQL